MKNFNRVYKNISREEYFKLPGVNASRLKPYYESALNGNYESSKERTETPAMRFGTACHSMILEPEKFVDVYDVLELPINEKTQKEYGADTKKAQEYIATLPKNKKYLSSEEFKMLGNIEANIANNKSAVKILNACPDREMALTWIDDESGIECKALLDFVGDKLAGDFKTTREIKFRTNPDDVAKCLQWELISNKNLLQFAFYMDGLLANDFEIEQFAVIFAQNNGNCETLTAFLSDYSLNYGRQMYSRAMLNLVNKDKNESAFKSIIEI
jgi:hypothetical protein